MNTVLENAIKVYPRLTMETQTNSANNQGSLSFLRTSKKYNGKSSNEARNTPP